MKRFRSPLVLFFAFFTTLSGQTPRLPREPEKLISRAQLFCASLVSGQRSKAVEFVLPDKKEIFLSAPPMPVISAKVAAVDLTTDIQRGSVRIDVEMLGPDLAAAHLAWTISSTWVWSAGNWYLDLSDPRDLFRTRTPDSGALVERMRAEIEAKLKLDSSQIDAGRITAGLEKRVLVPIHYSADLPLDIEPVTSVAFVTATAPKNTLTKDSDRFVLNVDSSGLEGPVSFPVQVRFRREAVTVVRSLIITADVFAPVTFRQVPAIATVKRGDSISVFIRNNTPGPIPLSYITVDGLMDILDSPPVLEPNQETEIRLRFKEGIMPENFILIPKAPVYEIGQFAFRIRTQL